MGLARVLSGKGAMAMGRQVQRCGTIRIAALQRVTFDHNTIGP